MKHTPLSISSSCDLCGGTGFFRQELPVDHPNFGKPLPCPSDAHTKERLERLSGLSDLTNYERTKTLNDINPNHHNQAMLEAARAMQTDPYGWLYIHGGPGAAKGDVLISLVNHFASQNKTALYIKFSRLVNVMRDALTERNARDNHFENGGDLQDWESLGYTKLFERVKGLYCIAIDEIDKDGATAFAEKFRFDFFDERYRQALAGETITIFASQTGPEVMPGPLADRFRDGAFTVIENRQPSSRPAMKRRV